MAVRDISVPALGIAAAGAVTVWAATKGVGLASGFRALLAGHTLPTGEDLTTQLTAAVDPGTAGDGGGGGELAVNGITAAALRYVGSGSTYRWGGGNPTGWDCSGYTNWVVCHDLGMAIPGYAGGSFTGTGHGPVTGQWAIWSGCQTIDRSEVGAGDLVIWPLFHMGIALDNQRMVNAPGPNGTPAPVTGRIDGAASGPLVCRRLLGRR